MRPTLHLQLDDLSGIFMLIDCMKYSYNKTTRVMSFWDTTTLTMDAVLAVKFRDVTEDEANTVQELLLQCMRQTSHGTVSFLSGRFIKADEENQTPIVRLVDNNDDMQQTDDVFKERLDSGD